MGEGSSKSTYWFGLVGLIVGLLSIILTIVFFIASVKKREPAFAVEPNRSQILSMSALSASSIEVLRKDGTHIVSDLTTLTFYFWNRGNESIRESNVLLPIKVRLVDTTSEIIDVRKVRSTRPEITNFQVNHYDTRSVSIAFDILEKGDGVGVQILFTGDPNQRLICDGTIEGVRSIKVLESDFFWEREFFDNFTAIFLAAVGLVILIRALLMMRAVKRAGPPGAIGSFYKYLFFFDLKKMFSKQEDTVSIKRFDILYIGTMIIMFTTMFILWQIMRRDIPLSTDIIPRDLIVKDATP